MFKYFNLLLLKFYRRQTVLGVRPSIRFLDPLPLPFNFVNDHFYI